MKKLLVFASFLLLFSLVIAGCGGSSKGTGSNPDPEPQPEGIYYMDKFNGPTLSDSWYKLNNG